MPRTAVAIRHLGFEDLGSFASPLAEAGYTLRYHDIGIDALEALDPVVPDLLIVLGGPVGVGDAVAYPFLEEERALVAARLAAGRPTLGLCLGAQMMAAALGAPVASMGHREIGFAPLELTAAGLAGPLAELAGVPVLHWHGDAFALPPGAERLAHTPACAQQAFALGPNCLGLQFHPEAEGERIERWLIGHAAELAAAPVDIVALRADARRYGPALRTAGQALLTRWLKGVRP